MKAYTIALYSVEIKEKELKAKLDGKGLDEYNGILMNICLDDEYPSFRDGGDYGIYYTDENAAWNAMNHGGQIIHYPDNHLYHNSGVAVEMCEIDEDGDFLVGSDYNWVNNYTAESLQNLHDELFGKSIWYAVMENREDTDWGHGSFDLDEAKQMAIVRGSDAYIAVIDNGSDSVCIEEISQEDF